MRVPGALGFVFVLALGADALAHGGTYRGPRSDAPPGVPSGVACDCARPDCARCSHAKLRSGERLLRSEIVPERGRRWNDFVALTVTATYRATADQARPIEAFSMLAPSAVFAATAGTIRQGGSKLTGVRRPSKDARRRYLWAVRRGKDPFLLIRRGPGRYHLRAFPVSAKGDTVVAIEGFALAEPLRSGAPRFYRTGDRVLVVRDVRPDRPVREGELAAGGRALRFCTPEEARGRHGPEADRAREVPFVHALESAATGRGDAAASGETVLAALEPDSPLPPEGREPVDPVPPPPPPSQP